MHPKQRLLQKCFVSNSEEGPSKLFALGLDEPFKRSFQDEAALLLLIADITQSEHVVSEAE